MTGISTCILFDFYGEWIGKNRDSCYGFEHDHGLEVFFGTLPRHLSFCLGAFFLFGLWE